MIPLLQQHPFGDLLTPFCTHLVPQHPNGHDVQMPWGIQHVDCKHMRQEHPNGNCNFGPCVHPFSPVSRDEVRHIVYYTSDATVRLAVEEAFDRLLQLGLVGSQICSQVRPLRIFNRAPASDGSQTDLMWSHYDPVLHAIQIMQGHPIRETLFHEIGHAIIGQKYVHALAPGSPHSISQPAAPGDALSEGWAHFVAAAIAVPPDTLNAAFDGIPFESPAASLGAPRKDVEAFVARCLWDLFDTSKVLFTQDAFNRFQRRTFADDERASLSFRKLYDVWNPTLQTLLSGPIIPDLDNYISRLKANNPSQSAVIDAVVALNFP